MPSDGVDLVDENDAGSVPFSLKEEVSHPGGPDPHKHLHEIRTTDAEEGNVSLACNRPCQKCLPRSRGTDKKNSFGNPSAKLCKLLGVPKKIDDLLQFIFGFFNSSDILKCHLMELFRQNFSLTLSKREGLSTADLHLSHEKEPDTDEDNHRK